MCGRITWSDGVMSIENVMDRALVSPHPNHPWNHLVPFSFRAHLLLRFVTGGSEQGHRVSVICESPARETFQVGVFDLDFTQQRHSICNLPVRVEVIMFEEGVYWFRVSLDGRNVTNVPVEVVFKKDGLDEA